MEMADIPEDSPVWPRVTSTPENCLGSECPFFEDCHVVKARREAMEADLVVVNHHLLMADLALKQEGFGEILPGADAFILDEAHQIPELAGQFFSQSVSSRQVVDLGQDALAEAQGVTGATSQLLEPVEAIHDLVKRLRLAIDPLPSRGPFGALDREAGVRDSTRSHIMSKACCTAPTVRMAWWMRPPPSRSGIAVMRRPPQRARRRGCGGGTGSRSSPAARARRAGRTGAAPHPSRRAPS